MFRGGEFLFADLATVAGVAVEAFGCVYLRFVAGALA